MHKLSDVEACGGYSVAMADPAWSYVQQGRGVAENHYRTMPVAEVQALPISRLMSRDAVLFLWGTWPQLPVVLATGAAWGFEYKTCGFVWVKYHEGSEKRCIGGGFWTRANTEFCLLFTRGDVRRVDATAARSVRQLIETDDEDKLLLAPRGRHSEKPAAARERIVELMGDVPRIELFARQKVEGWSAWGNEIDADVDFGK